jgi:hypothetical protein
MHRVTDLLATKAFAAEGDNINNRALEAVLCGSLFPDS